MRENLDRYELWMANEHSPAYDVTVEVSDSGYGEFDTFVTTTYAGGGTFDALYGSDHWLAKWAEAGWILPLEDYYPEVLDYTSDISDFSLSALTYNGKIYGLPYYSDVMYFVYNQKMLDDAGIAAPPTTWAEVTQQSQTLMEKGITQTPFLVGLKAGSWFDEAFFALTYSEGAQYFDEEFNPTFETSSGPVYDMIEWMAASLNDTKIMPQKVLEMQAVDVQEAFKNGDAAFAIVPGYMMLEFNTPGISKIAGHAKISMMPGATHETDGFTRLYLLGNGAVDDEVTRDAAWALIENFGGKTTMDGVADYHVVKRWSNENGLGFSVKSLWQDPEVEKAFSAMADTTIMQNQKELTRSKAGMQAPWFAEWINFVRTDVQKALLRETSTQAVLENLTQQWIDLSSE
ncbi:MAG: extracellular solute-binding protein [Chloroflexi bacterium]|nr:extracellular solute-binding protein [Anaerolineaceae bacterium]NMB86951.1 extracellular solute-binding protein [Chloroflexota bacterium]